VKIERHWHPFEACFGNPLNPLWETLNPSVFRDLGSWDFHMTYIYILIYFFFLYYRSFFQDVRQFCCLYEGVWFGREMFVFVTHGSIFRETVCLANCYTRNRVIQYVLSGRFAHSSLTSGDNSPEPHVLALGDWHFEVPRGDHGTMAPWHHGTMALGWLESVQLSSTSSIFSRFENAIIVPGHLTLGNWSVKSNSPFKWVWGMTQVAKQMFGDIQI